MHYLTIALAVALASGGVLWHESDSPAQIAQERDEMEDAARTAFPVKFRHKRSRY